MKIDLRRHAFILALSGVSLLSACSGGYEIEMADGSDPSASEDVDPPEVEEVDENTVLGMSWQELSYPFCFYPWSDPDGDGWGWEFNRSCVVYKAPAPAPTPTPAPTPAPAPTGSTCTNAEGTASTMAAVAVSAAMELGRWQPTQDFAIGKVGWDEYLVLSATGKARCTDGCANTQALLDFQKPEADGKVIFPGNVKLSSVALRSRMVAKFRDQIACEKQPSNGGTTNCPVEDHTLTFQRSEKGGCDTNYFFVARKPDGSPLQYPGQLKNKLLWADRVNPYIGFQSVGEVVSIDPTFGLNERGSVSTGACTQACVKIGLTNVEGDCCSCNNVTKTFKKSPWSSFTYLCQ